MKNHVHKLVKKSEKQNQHPLSTEVSPFRVMFKSNLVKNKIYRWAPFTEISTFKPCYCRVDWWTSVFNQ